MHPWNRKQWIKLFVATNLSIVSILLEFSCGFEAGECNEYFHQLTSDTFDWTRRNRNTPSRRTGPRRDHTTSTTGKFMFVVISQLRCSLTFAGQSFNILIVLRASGLKATSSEA